MCYFCDLNKDEQEEIIIKLRWFVEAYKDGEVESIGRSDYMQCCDRTLEGALSKIEDARHREDLGLNGAG